MIHDYKILGNVVDVANAPAWFNNWNDNAFHEVGSTPGGGYSTTWRVSFTPSAAGKYLILSSLSNRAGDGNYRGRLYYKARIVRIEPTYRNDFSMYQEGLWEGGASDSNSLRWLNVPTPLIAVDDIPAEGVGVVHTYGVEHYAGDSLQGQVGYGSPLLIMG